MWLLSILVILLLALQKPVQAGLPSNLGEYVVTVWTTDDGLPQNSVFSLAESSDGHLWMATRNGLGRFDGHRFTRYSPENSPGMTLNRIRTVVAQPDGSVWVHASDGSMVSYKDGRFTTAYAPPPTAQHFLHGFIGNSKNGSVFSLSSGRLLIGTPSHMTLFEPPPELRGEHLFGHAGDKDGRIWYITEAQRIARFSEGRFTDVHQTPGMEGKRALYVTLDAGGRVTVATDKGISALIKDRFETISDYANITNMFPARNGGLWLWTGAGISKWTTNSLSTPVEPPTNAEVRGMTEDSSGRLWLATFGKGLWRIDPNGVKIEFTAKNSLPGDRVYSIMEDRDGNMLTGVDGGLVRLRPARFQSWGPDQGVNERTTTSVCPDGKGGIWLGTYGSGLFHFEEGKWNHIGIPGIPTRRYIYTVLLDWEGKLWFGTRNYGLLCLEKGIVTRPLRGRFKDTSVRALFEDSKHQLWVGEADNLHMVSPDREHFERIVANADVRCLAEDPKGGMWIGTQGRGLIHWQDGKMESFTKTNGLPSNLIWSLLAEPDGTLWIGTAGAGISRYRNGTFASLNRNDGLPNETICHLEFDDFGRMWASTYQGVFNVSRAALNARADGKGPLLHCLIHSLDEGLPAGECSGGVQPSGFKSPDGTLWFPTANGIASLKPTGLASRRTPTPVILETKVDNKPLAANKEAPAGSSRFTFQFTAPTLSAPEKVRFRYRLDGLHHDWIDAADRREASFDHLAPGDYQFHVTAANADGVWSATNASISFAVLPFYWQTRSFQIIFILLAASLLAGFVRWYSTRELRRRLELAEHQTALERERSRIARDMHDSLGTKLTTIALLGDLLTRGKSEPAELRDRIKKLSDVANETAGSLGDLIWTVNPVNDSLSNLATRLCQETDEFLGHTCIRCRFDLPDQFPGIMVSSEVRRQIVLAVAEAVNNAVKHSGATELTLAVRLDAASFTIQISDNGRGLPAQPAPNYNGGNGLPNMQQRLEKCGGTFSITNQPTGGVLISLTIPHQRS